MKRQKILSVFLALTLISGVTTSIDKSIFISSASDFILPDGKVIAEADIDIAKNKPEISVSKIKINPSDIPDDRVVYANIMVEGADDAYCTTGIHLYFDDKLSIARDKYGNPDVKYGNAVEKLISNTAMFMQDGSAGIFLSTVGMGNYGHDGIYATIPFVIPEDANIGDKYILDLKYEDNDLFIDHNFTSNGYAMMAYAFNHLSDGYIEIVNGDSEGIVTLPTEPQIKRPYTIVTDDEENSTKDKITIIDEYTHKPAIPENAINKPVISALKIKIQKSDIPDDRIVYTDIMIANADNAYCATGIHLYFDDKLSIARDKYGNPDVKYGNAVEKLRSNNAVFIKNGSAGIFLATAGKGNYGHDGIYATIPFIIPDDAKVGDKYILDLKYEDHDLFLDSRKTDNGYNMMAYAFNHLVDGYIEIVEDEPQQVITTTKPQTTSTTSTTTRTTYVTTTESVTQTTITTTNTDGENVIKITYPYSDQYVDPEAALNKPVISVSQGSYSESEIPEDRIVFASIRIAGAEGAYSGMKIHLYYDSRLKVMKSTNNDKYKIEFENAASDMTSNMISYTDSESLIIFESTAFGKEGSGHDGIYVTIPFILPKNAKAGDKYILDLKYNTDDYFTDYTYTINDYNMMAYAFNHLVDGYIEIEPNETVPDDIEGSGKCGNNLYWNLTDGVLTISGSGVMWDFPIEKNCADTPWFLYTEYIKKIVVEDGVTSFSGYAFAWCDNLKEVVLPESLRIIGEYCFDGCDNITNIDIPSSVISIEDGAFQFCKSLTSITIPSSVISIGNNAFAYSNLKKIKINNPDCDIFDSSETIFNEYKKDSNNNYYGCFEGVICGYENSTAQLYANKYGYAFEIIKESSQSELKGDANGDNKVDISDVVLLKSWLLNSKKYSVSEQGLINADVQGNGNGVNSNDIVAIQQYALKLITKLPIANT